MAAYTITIDKDKVYDEISKTTSYTGSKMTGDDGSYQRISTTESDDTMLERFWDESKNAVCDRIKQFLISETEEDNKFILTLDFSNSFEGNLIDSMESSLFSFFVMSITAKWYAFTNKGESADYAAASSAHMEDFLRKSFYKKKPQRPTY